MELDKGIIVGCDNTQEWLLPIFWEHYTKHNSFPIAFFDFGMSKDGVQWIKDKGMSFTLPNPPEKEEIIKHKHKKMWEELFGTSIWEFRSAWFKKPLACKLTPFEHTIWLDLDCLVKGPLDALFTLLSLNIDIIAQREDMNYESLRKEKGLLLEEEADYNAGVIGFCKHTEVIEKWADLAKHFSFLFPGDQQALSRAIFEVKPSLFELPSIYNWSWRKENHDDIVIHHFHGAGKTKLIDQFLLNPASYKNSIFRSMS